LGVRTTPRNFRIEASVLVLAVQVARLRILAVLDKVFVALFGALVGAVNNAGTESFVLYCMNIVHLGIPVRVLFCL
jgi:hypothetical protein